MDCPACGTSNSRVLDTFKGVEDKRKRECPCGARWSSTETIDKGSLRVATGTDQSPPVSTNGKRSRRVTPNRGIPQPLGANDAGGVGGDLRSGSDSIPFLADQDPSLKTPQQVDPARVWTPGDWLRLFGKAWSTQFCGGARHYGHAGDGKACGQLADLIAALPPAESLAAQEQSAQMFAEFFRERSKAIVDARHPFAFFVQRWGGLRVPALPLDPSSQRPRDPRVGSIAAPGPEFRYPKGDQQL